MTEPSSSDTTARVRNAIGGDLLSFDWVVSRFQPLVEAHIRYRLGSLARSADVEDLAQDVWFVAMQKLRDLEPRDGRFGAVLVAFLSSTSTYLCNNFLRSQVRRGVTRSQLPGPGDTTAANDDLVALTTGVVTRVSRSEIKSKLDAAIQALDPTQRDIVILRLCEKLSVRSIAQTLEIPKSSVADTYKRALTQLRRDLPPDAFDAIRSCTVRV